ncbi:MAG: replicative DNA helicase [Clostridia bacterium]|nr:replicative DNA helicase [Candidatus Pelethousia sp.]NCB30757.1 replicative DNA helicase [Clostridia bacterium]
MEQARAKVPPHSNEAEKSILGSMLISKAAVEQAMEVLRAQDFYFSKHQDIFTAMRDIYTRGGAVDTVTLLDALQRAGTLEALGGAPYITELSVYVPSAANAPHYIRIVSERSVLRQLMEAGGRIAAEAAAGEKPLEVLLNDAERAIFNISMKKSQDTMIHIRDTVIACYDRLGELMKHPGQLTGVPTGFADLDNVTSGLQGGDLVILAARPSMGKTAFALNIAQNAATRGKRTVCIFSLEMPREQLVQRMLCSESGVNMQAVRTGQISDDQLLRIAQSLEPVAGANIYIDDTPGCSVAEVRSKSRRLKSKAGLDMLVIDYLQQMDMGSSQQNQTLRVSETTRALKILARELNVPILLLSQLSRAPEQRSDHRPVMSDLRDSGGIEQDADLIMLLYRPAFYDEGADATTEVILAKHRNGPTCTVRLAWLSEYTRFSDITDREES